MKKLIIRLIKLSTIEVRMAHPKPCISKPLTVAEVIESINPLITKVKRPREMIFRGRVNIISRGLITAFITPRNMDPTIAPQMVTSNPDKSAAVNTIARIFSAQRTTQPGINAPSFLIYKITKTP
jgi:hypothetical protein